jgi:tetratricopeptide (TPR) repeat protein
MAMTADDHYFAGIDFFGEKLYDQAIAAYRQALALDPRFADALHGIAQANYAKGDFDAAIAAAREILALDPGDVLAWTVISRSYQRKAMVREAEGAAAKARILSWKKQLQDGKTGGT